MTNMACTFYREIPSFELRFACNFKGCLDDRPMSMMGAIEHQAFHFCEVYKTQAHFNFKCEYCNVYHVNKSHHRLCLDDKTGIGHLPHLRSIYTVPMTDPEFHSCVDFSRFANHHMIAVTAEGVRLVPCDRASSLQPAPYNLDTSLPGPGIDDNSSYGRKSSSVSYRDLDNCDENSNSEKFGRPGGFQDRNQSGSREFRGRGRGGPRGRGERGFGRGRGRGGGHRDDDNGRENSFRGRGRGRGADHRGDTNSYRSRDSFDNNTTTIESKPKRDRSYSRSGSRSPCSPLAKKTNTGSFTGQNSRARSYSRSRSNSPLPSAAKKSTNENGRSGNVYRPCSYSRSRSSSPVDAAARRQDVGSNSRPPCSYSRSRSSSPVNSAAQKPDSENRHHTEGNETNHFNIRSYTRTSNSPKIYEAKTYEVNESEKSRSDRSYSRSGSRSPVLAASTKNSTSGSRPARSYSRSRSRSRTPPRNDVNNNSAAIAEANRSQEYNNLPNVYNTEPDNYMNSGYGSSRQGGRGRNQNTSNRWNEPSSRSMRGFQSNGSETMEKRRDGMNEGHQSRISGGIKRGAESRQRDCSYSKSRSSSP